MTEGRMDITTDPGWRLPSRLATLGIALLLASCGGGDSSIGGGNVAPQTLQLLAARWPRVGRFLVPVPPSALGTNFAAD